ncbi:DNA translocase FtsK [Deinococcus sp.]|uniref:DNA translocase FtsK n=1 Tax=Deinococcus sp. TaxID=47478 RepID=UPI003CC6261F
MTTRRAKKPTAAANTRFDGEVLGLVLFALGIFLAITVTLPATGTGFMATAQGMLLGWLGWSAYLLALIPAAYGVLIFLGRDLRGLTRRVLGGLLVVLALLCLHHTLRPGEAGKLASTLMTPPLKAVSYSALLLPLIALTLGLEVVFKLSPTLLLRRFFRSLSLLLAGAAGLVQSSVEARREGQAAAQARARLRGGLGAHIRDLETLRKLYPQARELGGWQSEARDAVRTLGSLDEAALGTAEKQLATWREVSGGFVQRAGQELHAGVKAEALEAGGALTALYADVKAGRHPLSTELPSTQASGALESIRRALVMDLHRLSSRASGLEAARSKAEKRLEKPDAAALLRELPAAQERRRNWSELESSLSEWRSRAEHYPLWPALTLRYDRAPTELAAQLAAALSSDPFAVMAQHAVWEQRLSQHHLDAQLSAQHLASIPVIDFSFEFDFNFDASAGASLPASAPASFGLPKGRLAQTLKTALPLETPAAPNPSPPARPTEAVIPAADIPTAASAPPPLVAQSAVSAAPSPLPVPKPKLSSPPPWEAAPERGTVQPAAVQLGAIDIAIPGTDLLDPIPELPIGTAQLDHQARLRAELINQTLTQFGLAARVVDFARGPTVTRYEIEPAPGEKISRIAGLSNDLARALAVGGVRVEAPVPGKSVIGLEVPNVDREPVTFHTAVAAPSFRQTRARLPIILGKSIDGDLMVGDLAKMPHLLIAGSTGSGKSVCVNTLITSLLYRYLPTDLRFLMIDPKMVELTPYDGIPHLVRGVVTNPVDAAGVLLGAVAHMERRYKMMSQIGAKNLEQFNAKMRLSGDPELPHLVIIIDELADLMITSPKEVESAIMRLAQMARATGMHLVLATQRPSVDILTSLIKVNVPARIAFAVSSSHDSRTILDSMGAERLTGMGDMLFYQPGLVKPLRLQGPYISEAESQRISDYLRRQVFEDVFVEQYGSDFDGAIEAGSGSLSDKTNMDFSDPHLRQAAVICIEEGQGSVSRLQRRLSVGHARAGKLMDMLEAMGIVSRHQGSKPRDILISEAELPEYFGR